MAPHHTPVLQDANKKPRYEEARVSGIALPTRQRLPWEGANTVGDLGKIRPLWEATKSATAQREWTSSPTSVIPLKDFSWAVAPSPKPATCDSVDVRGDKKRVEGESGVLMEPRGRALVHPAGPLLLEYAREGCPVNVGRPWSKEEIVAAAERGPHKSALA